MDVGWEEIFFKMAEMTEKDPVKLVNILHIFSLAQAPSPLSQPNDLIFLHEGNEGVCLSSAEFLN